MCLAGFVGDLVGADGDLTAANSRIEVLDKANESMENKVARMKKAYEGQLTKAVQDKKDGMSDAENAISEIEHLLDVEKANAAKLEHDLDEAHNQLTSSKSETLKAQQETQAVRHESSELQNTLDNMKSEVKAAEERHLEIMKSNEEEHVAEMNEAREKSEGEKAQMKADLTEEIDTLKASLRAVQVEPLFWR